MGEYDTSPEILQQQSDSIILGMRRMIQSGLKPEEIAFLERDEPRKHRDLIQVYLGIKPAASHLDDPFSVYDSFDGTDYFEHFPKKKDAGIEVLRNSFVDGGIVWNPALVQHVLTENADLPEVREIDGSKDSVERFFGDLERGREKSRLIVNGILLGYPRRAAELFVEFHAKAFYLSNSIWQRAESMGISIQAPLPKEYIFDLHEEGGIHDTKIKDEFVRLAQLTRFGDLELISYVRGLRAANIPGWQYFTSGNETIEDEKRATSLYEASQFDKKLGLLLKEYGL